MENVYKILNNIQTNLIIWGSPFDCNGADVIICVTGNPGVPDFYIEFASLLHKNTGLSVCIIGQAGHEEVPDYKSNVLQNQEHLFNLEGQLAHKLDLIDNFIDKSSKLHLIGHSIGAWLVAELLNKNEALIKRVSTINFLFPTLQRMAETKNGRFLNGILRRINFLVVFIFSLMHILPKSIKLFIINMYLKFNALPLHYNARILKYVNPKVGEKVLFLAYNEMDTVTSLNVRAIDKIKHLTNIIYSSRDGWAPIHYMDDFKTFQPTIQMREVNIDHAFVLKSSERVAEMVLEYIKIKT